MPYKDREARLAYGRQWRAANKNQTSEWRKANPGKVREHYELWLSHQGEAYRLRKNARNRVGQRVFYNKWPKPGVFLCTDCGSTKGQEYHHEDYSQWWNVEPLCLPCHTLRHN